MNNIQTQSQKYSSQEEGVALTKEHTTEGKNSRGDVNTFSTFPSEDSIPVIAEVKFEPETNMLSVILANWNLVSTMQSNTRNQPINCSHHVYEKQQECPTEATLQSESCSKAIDFIEKQETTELVNHQLQRFDEDQDHKDHKQADSAEMIIVSVDPPLPLIKKQGYLKGQQCERILEQLELLQDNGKFGEHERLVTTCIQHCANGKNADMELALKMERGVAFSYQKEFKTSKCMFTTVIKSDEDKHCQVRNANILQARAYFLFVEDLRSRRFVKPAPLFEFLRRSEFLLQNHDSPEDWAELYYNYGSVWLAYRSIIPNKPKKNAQARNTAEAKARYYFEQAFSFCKTDPRLRVQIKKQTYISLKLAELILDCSSTSARIQEKAIPPGDIKEAKEHLDYVQYKLGDSVPTGTRVQLLKMRSDQFYRQGLYQLAKETAEEALRLASSNGFNAELDTLQERIKFLDKKLEKFKLVVIRELEHSSSETCYCESDSG